MIGLSATFAEAQWVVEAYTLFLSALVLAGGTLGDLYGRRRCFSLGVLIFALASAACGLAPNPILLIVARAIQGNASSETALETGRRARPLAEQAWALVQKSFDT